MGLLIGMPHIVLTVSFAAAALVTALAALAWSQVRRRHMDLWIGSYLAQTRRRRPPERGKPVHVLLCIADHYEPKHGKVSPEQAAARVEAWVRDYPRLLGHFRDSDGRPPRHTFFYPIDEYEPGHLTGIASLCRQGLGEVEIHHHHDNDTAEQLRQRLGQFVELFSTQYGLLARETHSGRVRFAFVHGNWCLDNSRPDGRWCGVNNELDVLREAGCYADFTMPSAPSPTQTRKINSIYYATDDPDRPKSHDWGPDVGTEPEPRNGLLLVQGPLLLNWAERSMGLMPRIENGNLQGNQPPSMRRLDLWLRARVQVARRPDWFFVKLHTHGAPEGNRAVLLGDAMVEFHRGLARRASEDRHFHYHYVTAREVYNLVRAAEAGWEGEVAAARDYELTW